ncbi:hypothetical protein OAG52_04910 [Verrucomicrobia bacterium]|nr:hypothetical protein [Verrucomicrobiota bacterium]
MLASPTISTSDNPAESVSTNSLPWHCYVVIAGATSIILGVLWDISWHRTIGRDTFWTPAHMAIYLGGVLGGVTCGWLVIKSTFFTPLESHGSEVKLWGFQGPLGAWISIWGALAMLTSAPFDDWWHNAYGLDVEILSPPHIVLALGMWAIVLGALVMVLRYQNAGATQSSQLGKWFFLYAAGILIAMDATVKIEMSFPNLQHSILFYQVSATGFPLYLIAFSRASTYRWAATVIASVYIFIYAGMVWILPLFAAQPLLGPIDRHVDHFVPLPFPLLLVIPAIGIDLLRRVFGDQNAPWKDWLRSIVYGSVFLALFVSVQWYFSEFMLTDAAENHFFGANQHWGYTEADKPHLNQFWRAVSFDLSNPTVRNGFGIALLLSIVCSRIGLSAGSWLRKVQR